MASFQLPPAFFPENAITRAELIYQQRSAKPARRWRRWLNAISKGLIIGIVFILVTMLLVASLTERDPTPIIKLLGVAPPLLILFTLFYDLSLIFQTISLAANSISREREGQTWEMLVLTGINARQIVRGKWWATVQRQFPRYLLLGFIRAGASVAMGVSILASSYYYTSNYDVRMQLPHPLSILISVFLGVLLTVANLGFSAACGVMGSVVSKRSSMAVTRGIANQIVLSLIPAIVALFIFSRSYNVSVRYDSIWQSVYTVFGIGTGSLFDNGYTMLSSFMNVHYQYVSAANFVPIKPIEFDWIFAALLTLVWYGLLIWFALWRAEKRAVSALATPVEK